MKTIIIQYEEGSDLDIAVIETLAVEYSSKVSLAKRAILNYCNQKILEQQNAKPTK